MASFAIVTDPVLPVVKEGIATSESKANQAYEEASDLMDDMGGLIDTLSTIPQITAALGNVQANVTPFIGQTAPTEPVFDTSQFPSPPAEAATGTVGTITLSDAPVFTAAEPVINNITPPAAFTKSAPTEPALVDHSLPNTPSNTLPAAPTTRELSLPTAPSLIAVNFDGVIPTALATPPSAQFNWTNQDYSSVLNTQLKSSLLDLVLNIRQTGLNPTIEDQLWARGRERTSAESSRRQAAVRRQSASLGWNMPQGDEWLKLMEAAEASVVDDITESRSIAIAQATLEQNNFQFAFTQALALEGQLINLHNAEQQRLFEAARYTIEATIQLYGLEVSYFNANVGLYETQARVYTARLQAQLNEVEVFKAQLEGQKLIGDLNAQDVALYKAKIDAVVSTWELYKAELSGVKILLEQDSLKLQRFESNVRAFAEEIRAKSLENDIYKTQQDGENIKVQMYNGLASAFRSRIDGFKIESDAKIAKQDSDIKIAYDVPLQVADQATKRYQTTIAAESEKLKAIANFYETQGNVYDTKVKSEIGRVDAEVRIYEAELKKVIADGEISIDAAKANISTLLAQKEMLIGVQRTIAQVKAQLAASFGSAINYTAGISSGIDQNVSYNFSGSVDE